MAEASFFIDNMQNNITKSEHFLDNFMYAYLDRYYLDVFPWSVASAIDVEPI